MKSFIKKATPKFILEFRRKLIARKTDFEYENLSLRETFQTIYENQIWGRSEDSLDLFCSGDGSHNNEITTIYHSAIADLLGSFEEKLDVVDLGCGDFNVGSKVRFLCQNYIACDIVPSLIERNRKKFIDLNVDFRTLDIVKDTLPPGDLVFIRQVLQHLSNKQIKKIVKKLPLKYKYLVLTEHLPLYKNFIPNKDKVSGPNIRLYIGETGSGIVLTSSPFNLEVKEEKILCEFIDSDSIIRTIFYRLK